MIDREKIERIAKLARVHLNTNEVADYSVELSKIIEAFDQLSLINTEGIEPLITPSDIEYILREDKVDQQYSVDQMTTSSQDKIGNLFKVPPVV